MNKLLDVLQKESLLYNSKLHGIAHWTKVEEYGHYLCMFNDADKKVVSYFAYTHDCMRENEDDDNLHGYRSAQFAIKNRSLFDLNDSQFSLLIDACENHSHGNATTNNATIGTCWDADRLHLRRLSITPVAEYMHNKRSKYICDNTLWRLLP